MKYDINNRYMNSWTDGHTIIDNYGQNAIQNHSLFQQEYF